MACRSSSALSLSGRCQRRSRLSGRAVSASAAAWADSGSGRNARQVEGIEPNEYQQADQFGNFWLSPNHKEGPAVFPHKVMIVNADGTKGAQPTGKFSALLRRGRFLEDAKGERRFFDTPAEAMDALVEEGL